MNKLIATQIKNEVFNLALAAFNSLPFGKGWGWAAAAFFLLPFGEAGRGLSQTYMNIHLSDGSVTQIDISTIDSITYSVTNPGVLATITTDAATAINGPSAMSGGNITADGGTAITSRGLCWSTSPNPTTADDTTLNGTGVGSFSDYLTGLSANTTYYVRAYAVNSAGTAYGNQQTFTTGNIFTQGAGVTDIDGNFYPTIVLGTQEWMQQNLRTSHFANGDSIPNDTVYENWWIDLMNNNPDSLIHTVSNFNDSQYDNPYGKFYNYITAKDSRGTCPTGWHLPSKTEWVTLLDYLDPNTYIDPNSNYISLIADEMIMEQGSTHWLSGWAYGTNTSGFTALGASLYAHNFNVGSDTYWWTSSTFSPTSSSTVGFAPASGVSRISTLNYMANRTGISIRCMKD